MRRIVTRALSSRQVAPGCMELAFEWDGEAPVPGQFLTARVPDRPGPLLRRPFAFASWNPEARSASFVYLVRGEGTSALARLRPGDPVDLLGPLGNGFPVDVARAEGVPVAACGGGIGVGPVLFLADRLAATGHPVIPVFGFRTATAVPELAWPSGTVIATEDGTSGFRGTAIDALERALDGRVARVMACGPHAMLAALSSWSAARNLRCDASVEQWMACGVGACAGCAILMRGGSYRKACSDGPVFDGNEVDWEGR